MSDGIGSVIKDTGLELKAEKSSWFIQLLEGQTVPYPARLKTKPGQKVGGWEQISSQTSLDRKAWWGWGGFSIFTVQCFNETHQGFWVSSLACYCHSFPWLTKREWFFLLPGFFKKDNFCCLWNFVFWRVTGMSSLSNKSSSQSSEAQSWSFHPCWGLACTSKSCDTDTLLPSKSSFNTRTWRTNGDALGNEKGGRQEETDSKPRHARTQWGFGRPPEQSP